MSCVVKRVRATARGWDGIQLRERGDVFPHRIYDESHDSGWFVVIADATPEEAAWLTQHLGAPYEPPTVLPPDGPKTGTYQHEHKGGGWWTGRHEAPATPAGRTPTALSQIPMPQHGDVDPRSI